MRVVVAFGHGVLIFRSLLRFVGVLFRCCPWIIYVHHVDVGAAPGLRVHADAFLAAVVNVFASNGTSGAMCSRFALPSPVIEAW